MADVVKEAKAPTVAKATTAVAEKKKPQTLKDYVNVMMPEIKKALPSVITPERFTRIVLSAVSNNRADIMNCLGIYNLFQIF